MIRLFRVGVCGFSLLGSTAFSAEPFNVGKAAQEALAYHDNGAYQHDFDNVVEQARVTVQHLSGDVLKPAIVLDIDETTLSNWPAMQANNLEYRNDGACDHLPKGPCGWNAWVKRAEAPVFLSTKRLIEDAQKRHIAVFFITGRSEDQRNVTEKNLHSVGIHSWNELFLRPLHTHQSAEDYKAPLRHMIEKKGYHIIVNMGDQESDLRGGSALYTYKLPNPFYYIP